MTNEEVTADAARVADKAWGIGTDSYECASGKAWLALRSIDGGVKETSALVVGYSPVGVLAWFEAGYDSTSGTLLQSLKLIPWKRIEQVSFLSIDVPVGSVYPEGEK